MTDRVTLPLDLRLRPKTFDEVVGQESAVSALKRLLSRPDRPHFYLLSGPSGVGKTTLARIIASELEPGLVVERDAASHSSVIETRKLRHSMMYGLFQPRVWILDECHALTRAAWIPLLKVLEEPPQSSYAVFCTTEIKKIPETVMTRATHLALARVDDGKMLAYAMKVREDLGLVIASGAMTELVQRANGSPRRLLKELERLDISSGPTS